MTEIPVLLPPTAAELATPYLTADGFRAFPTWLDLDNLVPGGVQDMDDDELTDVALTASTWCDSTCEGMRLGGHFVQGEQLRTRPSGSGRVYLRPRDIPVRAITSLSFGGDPAAMTADALPDASMWNEGGREISFRPGGAGTLFTGPAIQFGAPWRPYQQVYVNWSYVAGFPSTTLAATLAENSSTVTLTDPTSVLPGDVLRIYDVGRSEALTVASTYAPAIPTIPPTATAVPLAAPAQNTHEQGTGITGMPRDILQAQICYMISLLMREDVSAEEPQSAFGPAARTTGAGRGGIAGGLINDAEVLLAPYRPVFRS